MKTLLIIAMVFVFEGFAQAQTPTQEATPQNTYRTDSPDRNVVKTGDVGLGLIIGSATGIDAKWWTTEVSAWRPGVVWSGGDAAVLLDYLYHFRSAFSDMTGSPGTKVLVPYAGIGGIASFGANNTFFVTSSNNSGSAAVRIPLGLEFLPRGMPIGIFAELITGAVIVPPASGYLQADVGAHYYF